MVNVSDPLVEDDWAKGELSCPVLNYHKLKSKELIVGAGEDTTAKDTVQVPAAAT